MPVLVKPVFAATNLSDAALVVSERDPSITALRLKIERRTVDIKSARDGYLPQFSLSADTSALDKDDRGITLSVSQMLYDWGKVGSQVESASQQRVVAVSDLKSAIEDSTLDVSNYFIDIEVTDRKIVQTQTYLAFANRILGYAEDRATAGVGDNGEVARARLEVGRAEDRMTQLEGDRSLSVAQLEFLMGKAPGDLSVPPELHFIDRYSGKDSVEGAVRMSPDYISAGAETRSAEAAIKTARASRLPTIRVQALAKNEFDSGDTRSAVGLSTGVDLGMSGVLGRQIKAAEMDAAAARANMDAIQRNMVNAAKSALKQISVLKASEDSQDRQLEQSQKVLDSYEQQFAGGQRQLIDLLTTSRDLYDAQIDLIGTYEDRKRAEYQAAHDLGVLGTLILANSSRS